MNQASVTSYLGADGEAVIPTYEFAVDGLTSATAACAVASLHRLGTGRVGSDLRICAHLGVKLVSKFKTR